MKVRFGLRSKFLVIFLLLALVLSSAIAYVTRISYESTIIEKYYDHAISIVKLAASVMDGDRIQNYARTLEMTEEYQADLDRLNNIKQETEVYYLYVMYPLSEEEGIYIFDASLTQEQIALVGEGEATLGDLVNFGDNFPSAMEVLKSGEPSNQLDITTTMQGENNQTLASAYAPIFNSDNQVVAFAGVDVNMTDVDTYVQDASYQVITTIVCITVLGFLVLLLIVQISILRPMKKLTKAAENLADGKYGTPIAVRGRDEISEITRVFNRMSVNIKGHMDEMNELNEAYHKYVPSRFFEFLQKESVISEKLGSQKQKELTVLNFDLIDFEYRFRRMSSREMFAFINQILQQAIPQVTETDGMVETFQGTGFTALYSNSCEEALSAAVSICQKLNEGNRNQKFGADVQVEFGIGIAYGSVMLGIVGHESRMSAISISRQTEIAAFLRKLASRYCSHILITGTAAARIADFFSLYHVRVIGYIRNTFTGHMEKIYDVYDGDEEEYKRLKDLTKDIFEEGVSLYCARKFYEARIAFVKVLKQFRKDAAAREYLFLCNQYYQEENPQEIDICIEQF
ncbi:MAG: HAMP domain-containing protein [Lachnospiraceae bacterium]|nr:HAMP domain-containing protein [Lachnospiraceae bacterium]